MMEVSADQMEEVRKMCIEKGRMEERKRLDGIREMVSESFIILESFVLMGGDRMPPWAKEELLKRIFGEKKDEKVVR